MYFRKLFTPDQPYIRRESRYLEGRGRYPERREENVVYHEHDRTQSLHDHSPSYSKPYANNHANIRSNHHATSSSNRRRMPLTTLDALVQIKANGLAHSY